MQKNLFLTAGLLALPLVGAAQTAAETPRFYLGAGVSVLTGWPFHTGTNNSNLVGPALTAGIQFTPGWRCKQARA